MAKNSTAKRDALLLAIARTHIGFRTLETRNSDCLDFHEVSAEGLRRALVAAYEAGANAQALVFARALDKAVR